MMENQPSKELQTTTNQLLSSNELAFAMQVDEILSVTKTIAFQTNPIAKGLMQANAMEQISKLLTPELMKPVEKLFGSSIGIKTDKKYDSEVMKRIFIEATLGGWGIVGNQINVIGGNMYPTKNGYLPRLRAIEGLKFVYPFKHQLPEQDPKHLTWSVTSNIQYEYNGKKESVVITNPTKKQDGQSADALWGKADTKCCRWLWNKITGEDTMDDSGFDNGFTVPESVVSSPLKMEHAEEVVESGVMISEELQTKFDGYVSKATSKEDLITKATTWLNSSGAKNAGASYIMNEGELSSTTVSLVVFNEILNKFK